MSTIDDEGSAGRGGAVSSFIRSKSKWSASATGENLMTEDDGFHDDEMDDISIPLEDVGLDDKPPTSPGVVTEEDATEESSLTSLEKSSSFSPDKLGGAPRRRFLPGLARLFGNESQRGLSGRFGRSARDLSASSAQVAIQEERPMAEESATKQEQGGGDDSDDAKPRAAEGGSCVMMNDVEVEVGTSEMNMSDNDLFYNATRAQSLIDLLSARYGVNDAKLMKAIAALGEAAEQCAVLLSSSSYVAKPNRSATTGVPDDVQLPNLTDLYVDCDNAVFENARKSRAFAVAVSDVNKEETPCSDDGEFSLSYEALDGTSIVEANMAVGSIFGIWPGSAGITNRLGREQVASALAVYGPRTTLCIALASEAMEGDPPPVVFEVTLVRDRSQWELTKDSMTLQYRGKIFAPGNLRAINDNPQYGKLVQHWMEKRYSLRYSGGIVPDIYHILSKSKGVFTHVSGGKPMAKLRLMAPIALMIESAGGAAIHDEEDLSILHMPIEDLDQRVGVCLGSKDEVSKYIEFMFN